MTSTIETTETVGAEREQGVLDTAPSVDTLFISFEQVAHRGPKEAPLTIESGAAFASGGPMPTTAVADPQLDEEPLDAPRFRCVACRHRAPIGTYDHHCSVGGRICGACMADLPLPVRSLIDRYGISGREAIRCHKTWGTDAKHRLDLVVRRLGGNPDRSEHRCIETLIERRQHGVEAEMVQPGTSPHHRSRGGHLPMATIAMTRERRLAMTDSQQRDLLAREYGSLSR